ncbi:MAG: IPT/TIG domain-containing protein, partial [Pirellulales bacterium]
DNSHIPAIEHAFQSWTDVSGSSINLVRGADTASGSTAGSGHTITFDETNSSGFFPSGSGIVAITPINYMLADGRITDADILFNGSQFTFSTNQTSGTFDVQDILTHEVGHFIGLDHSPVVSGTMWPYVSQTQWLHRSLSPDDAAGAVAVATRSGQTKVTGTIRKPGSTSGLAGAIVSASLTDGRFVASTATNSNGNFTLRGMPAGDYYIHIDPLEGGMSSANLTSNSSTSTAFAATFYGGFDNPTLFSLTSGAQLSCGILTANDDIAMYESASSTTLLQQGTSSLVTIYGNSIPAGTTMVAKTNELTISNITSNSSYVRATVTANSAAMVASYNLYIKSPDGDFEVAPGVVEVIQPAPNLAAVSQFKVSSIGGETITLSGTSFQDGAFVLFGGYESEDVTFIDSNTLSVVTPAVPLSIVDVAVHNPDGQQTVLNDGIAFTGQAVFTQSWPTKGQSAGGTNVFINGDNFNEVSKFYIDGQQVSFTFKSAKIVHLQMPAHALGSVELTIENPASPDLV